MGKEIKAKRDEILNQGFYYLYDNTLEHSAVIAKEAIRKCQFKELDFINLYNLDLSPNDYYLFSKLKFDLLGKILNLNDDVKRVVTKHF